MTITKGDWIMGTWAGCQFLARVTQVQASGRLLEVRLANTNRRAVMIARTSRLATADEVAAIVR